MIGKVKVRLGLRSGDKFTVVFEMKEQSADAAEFIHKNIYEGHNPKAFINLKHFIKENNEEMLIDTNQICSIEYNLKEV